MTEAENRLARATGIVEEALHEAMTFFAARETIATREKGFQDFVSEADTSIETLIRKRLAAAFPGEAIVGEELGGVGGNAYWIIDPIDGTANFLRGSPLWGISLGHVTDGRPDLGVVALPVFGEVYGAAEGTGLLRNGAPLARGAPLSDVRVVSLGDSAKDDIAEIGALHTGLREAGWVVEALHTTSVSLVFAARGIFDGHLQKLTTMWDIAGGAVLAREAGLDVRIGLRTGPDGEADIPWIAAGTAALLEATAAFWPEVTEG
ncbi:myo-inositol-1(or 4)-monophosphatase [Rhizobium sp. PP-F2F-G48]|uniref:inositol monophosphatase family protein n=1 Tax=Rhizobium sp. PP-F2F-G48 TaxID=2135651 RepID=UPI001042C20A|nr:inositol monophosphatase family protein [Rhizobium sp. PP-F2F-G48]TCM52225.1 myo-inositol-1(or 4)-monophosphatase [Rhizobium sp. PP-F2F-G48]